jgi:hypothetical protein
MDTKKQNDVNATESLGVTERRVVLNLSQDQAEKLLQWLNYSDTRHVIASDDVTETIDKIRARISKTLSKHYEVKCDECKKRIKYGTQQESIEGGICKECRLGHELANKMGVTGPDGN